MGSANTSRHAGIRTFIPRKLMFYSLTLRAKHTSFWCRLRVSVLRFLVKTKPSQVGDLLPALSPGCFMLTSDQLPQGKISGDSRDTGLPFVKAR